MNRPLRFVIVGSGWRAMFYVRIARRYPEQFQLLHMLCRSEEKAQEMRTLYQIPATASEEECEAAAPDFVVTVISKGVLYEAAMHWAWKGIPVLCETPAGIGIDQLKELWTLHTGGSIRIQIAEQYHRYPMIAAGLQAIAEGKLGDPNVAYLSAAHDHHAASLLRHMLALQPGPVRLQGKRYAFPVTETDSRAGAITDGRVKQGDRTVVTLEYAGGKVGFYDFSGVQYHSFIRARHVNVQGSKGEWNDTVLRYVNADHLPEEERLLPWLSQKYAPLHTEELQRQSAGWNPFLTLDQAQDEYAVATMLYDLRAWLEKGTEVYPLAEALEDAYTRLLMRQAAAHPETWVVSEPMPWHVPTEQ